VAAACPLSDTSFDYQDLLKMQNIQLLHHLNVELLGLRRPFPVGVELVGERTAVLAAEVSGQLKYHP
jgi:hypothetical protein